MLTSRKQEPIEMLAGEANDPFAGEFAVTRAMLGGTYEISSLLAVGGMSRIYAGTRAADGLPIVIKVLHEADALSLEVFRNFPKRAALCLKLRHPNLVPVLEWRLSPHTGHAFLVMERVHGPTLRQFFFEHIDHLTIGRLLEVFHQIALGIDAMHADGMIHRDIKPDNVLLDAVTGVPRIVDFGLALGFREITEKAELDAFGSPAYMAPEQVIGTTFGPEVDVYAFAMCIYTLLTRCLPFDVADSRELVLAHLHLDPVPIRRRNRNWPVGLERALARSLSRCVHHRHHSALELATEVAEALSVHTPFRIASFLDESFSRFSSGEIRVDLEM